MAGLLLGAWMGSAAAAPGFSAAATPWQKTGSPQACVPSPEKVVASVDGQSEAPMPAKLAAAYDAAAAAIYAQVRTWSPAAIVGVRSPAGTWKKGYGVANLASGAPATPAMYHHVASITKTFTGTVLLQLAAEGALSLDDPVSVYVSGVPNGSNVSLRNLVNMRSGLPDYVTPEWEAERLTDPDRQWSPQELLAVAWTHPPVFPPGSDWDYSNTNYILLGLVIEQVTGHPLREEIAQRILQPQGLSATELPIGAEIGTPHLNGYTALLASTPATTPAFGNRYIRWFDVTNLNLSWEWGAGQMTSRADDLLAWGRVLATGQGVLPASAQLERLRSFGPSHLEASEFYGSAIMCKDGWIGHGGNTFGYQSMLRYNPDTDTTIVVEINGMDTRLAPPHLIVVEQYTAALSVVAGHPYSPRVFPQ